MRPNFPKRVRQVGAKPTSGVRRVRRACNLCFCHARSLRLYGKHLPITHGRTPCTCLCRRSRGHRIHRVECRNPGDGRTPDRADCCEGSRGARRRPHGVSSPTHDNSAGLGRRPHSHDDRKSARQSPGDGSGAAQAHVHTSRSRTVGLARRCRNCRGPRRRQTPISCHRTRGRHGSDG